MRLYRVLDRLPGPRTYIAKIFLACFIGTHVPITAFIIYVALRFGTVTPGMWEQLGILFAGTLIGTVATLIALYALLSPIRQTRDALVAYTERQTLPDLPTGFCDEAGVLMAQVQETLEHLHAMLQDLSTQALTDTLTKVGNRRWLELMGTQRLLEAARTHEPIAVIVFDLDHFKKINDQYGHMVGDAVLQQAAETVRQEIRTADIFARIGGEEFCLMMPQTEISTASIIAERMRAAIAALPFAKWPGLQVTASFGVSPVHGGEATLAAAIARADQALYEAKQRGRNRVALQPA